MPLDSITLSALTRELQGEITDMKIDKVQQPERDTIILTLHGAGRKSLRLALCGGVGNARVHITAESFENPMQPPMFCMLLRKHLVGARIASLSQPSRERILVFALDAFNEMRIPEKRKLIVEMIGRGTNIILVDGEGIIVDCLRRVDAETSPLRQVMPGMIYRLPVDQKKPDFFSLSSGERREMFKEYDEANTSPEKWLLSSFSCLSPLICREMVHRCYGEILNLPEAMDALCDTVSSADFTPYMLLEDGKPKEFSFMRIAQYGDILQGQAFDSFSQLLDTFFTRRSKAEAMKRKVSGLRKSVKTTHDRTVRKLAAQEEEIILCADKQLQKRYGDLLTANLYLKISGQNSITLSDFYEEDGREVIIALDSRKTMQQNAAAYYKQYSKRKSAEEHLVTLIETSRRDEQYLASVLDEIDRAVSESEIAEIHQELEQTGFIKRQKASKKMKIPAFSPLKYVSASGIEILIGRSNTQNDTLTFKTAHRGDIWLHTQKIHGSHVIIRCAGQEVDDDTLAAAASLAALHSQAGENSKVPVDYTRVKFVKKPTGAMPGMVIYTDYETIMAVGDQDLEESIKVR